MGQVVTRSGAWAILVAYIMLAQRPVLRPAGAVLFFVSASVALPVLHLVPLPPAIWTALPSRELFEQAATVSGQNQPWRPLSISPGATVNALSSLIVPVVALLLAAAMTRAEQWRIAILLLGLIIASALLGLVQFTGGNFDHPLLNDVRGSVSASFANRNHFALFAAVGCVLAPAWAFREGQSEQWKVPVALALLLFFILIILATGSRTGMVLGAIALPLGLLAVRHRIGSELRRLPKPVSLTLIAVCGLLLVAMIVLSISLGRAASVDRIFALDPGDDLRRQALPTVWEMTKLYFPVGSGLGTFDPVYRIHESDSLLGFQYFNRAHSDLLEVVLDAGLPGLLLLVSAIGWWMWKSGQVWFSRNAQGVLPRLGSSILLLIMLASITDYPARTPMIMAMAVLAGIWLTSQNDRVAARSSG